MSNLSESPSATGDGERVVKSSSSPERVSLGLGVTCSVKYFDLCVDMVTTDAGACGQDEADIPARARAWATYLAPRVPRAALAATYLQVRGERGDRFGVTPQEIVARYNLNARAAGARSGERCDYCTQGRIEIFNLALRENVERWCPKCQTEKAAQEPRLPTLRLPDIPRFHLVSRSTPEDAPERAVTDEYAMLSVMLDAIGEHADIDGRYDFEGLLESGLCPTCRNTGFEMTRRSGGWGHPTVAGATDGKTGYRTRRLIPCTCPMGEKYGGGERRMMPGATQESLPEWVR